MRPRKPIPSLNAEQLAHLQRICDTHPNPYIRERAAVLLKLADRHTLSAVSRKVCETVRRRCCARCV